LHRLSLAGLGFVNDQPERNGEDRFLARHFATSRGRNENPVVFDVGANCGDFAAMVLKLNPGAKVYCFEPGAGTFSKLQQRFSGESRVVLVNAAVGSAAGELYLFDYANSAGSPHASLLREAFEDIYATDARKQTVPVLTLDAFAAANSVEKIDFLKVDVEGFEGEVFAGAAQLIKESKIATVQCEMNAHHIIARFSIYQLAKLFPAHDVFRLVSNGLVPVAGPGRRYNAIDEVFKYSNYVLQPARSP
jgi:FkbM family methyltransferase